MIIDRTNYSQYKIGKKAGNLFDLAERGYPVPPLFCVNDEKLREDELNTYLEEHFPDTETFSVRSSASVEDSEGFSFAGQFDTYLNVKKEEVYAAAQKVFSFAGQGSVQNYCREQGLDVRDIHMSVIVQEMIDSDYSGVLFTANPQGILNETVIVLGKGVGVNVVEDRVDTTTYYYNLTDRIYYYEQTKDSPLFSVKQVEELVRMAEELRAIFDMECDMEFAVRGDSFYLLQVRPITTFSGDVSIILDNSNIVESYPNITLPLTQSFVREVYYKVFRSLLLRLTKEEKTVDGMDEVLRNMVDVANGRVYYRISNWYDIILLLPFQSKIIPIWQEMLGVQNKAVSFDKNRKAGFTTRLKVTASFFGLLGTNPRKMEELDRFFKEVLLYFDTLDTKNADNETLISYYRTLEKKVTDRWDITLVNDMYSFIYTGLLKACLKKKEPDYEVLTKRYISQIADMESLKPIKELMALSKAAAEGGYLSVLEGLKTNEDYERFINEKEDAFRNAVKAYIALYGDRNLEELKLESKTFRTDPILLIRRILQYVNEDTVVQTKEEAIKPLKGFPLFCARRAALGICNREKSRLNRSRLYGIMRLLMLQIGENLCREGSLRTREDIFWLYFDEVVKVSGHELPDVEKLLTNRKQEYRMFESLPAYTRLIFAGKVTDKNPKNVCGMRFERNGDEFRGVACSGGVTEGEVLIVEKPTVQMDTRGRILVTKMTDPGWVFLIADAKGIIAEKGSLLSHTAIISRELGKPAVVGAEHITKLLKNGDYVRLDGDRGEITILSQ